MSRRTPLFTERARQGDVDQFFKPGKRPKTIQQTATTTHEKTCAAESKAAANAALTQTAPLILDESGSQDRGDATPASHTPSGAVTRQPHEHEPPGIDDVWARFGLSTGHMLAIGRDEDSQPSSEGASQVLS